MAVDLGSASDDVFAWEIAPTRRARATGPSRWGASIRGGMVAAALPAVILFVVYVARAWEWNMPWVRIGSILAVFAPLAGALLALLVEGCVVVFDRVRRAWWPLGLVANPLTAGVVGGALAGIGPGAVGVTVFGSYEGPFVGTALLAGAMVGSALLVVVPIARRCVGGGAVGLAVSTVIATALLCGVAAVAAPIVVANAFAQIGNQFMHDGPLVGIAVGMIGGGILGLYVGLVIVVGRLMKRMRS